MEIDYTCRTPELRATLRAELEKFVKNILIPHLRETSVDFDPHCGTIVPHGEVDPEMFHEHARFELVLTVRTPAIRPFAYRKDAMQIYLSKELRQLLDVGDIVKVVLDLTEP